MLQSAILIAVEVAQEAPKGGLFQLDATLPLVAVQTLILMAILNAVFYKPFRLMFALPRERIVTGKQIGRAHV